MKINHSKFCKATELSVLRSLVLGCAFFVAAEVRADGYAECNQILVQDVFNRTTTSGASSSQANAEALATIFQMSAHDAYKEYAKKYDEAKEKVEEGSGEGGFGWGFISAEGSGKVSSKNKLSEEEFSKEFNKAKDEFYKSSHSKSSSSQNLVNNYASYVRDPGTVSAWKDCVTKTKDTDLYAFASRDQAGKTFINVIWVPGVLAGSLPPSISISFVTDGDAEGVNIHANPEEQVAMGSGRNFAVSCGTKCDNGFQVTVNGTLKNAAGIATNSFTSSVDVPPLKPPVPPTEQWLDNLAARGEVLSNEDPLSVELRKRASAGPGQRGFDIGMAAAEGHTLPGPGKDGISELLNSAEKSGFNTAVSFSLERNKNFEFAAKGAAIAKVDPIVAKARTAIPSVFYWLGFDIATGIFGDPALGAQGNTATGPGSLGIRNSLSADGQKGFDASVKLHLGPPPLPRGAR